MDELPLLRRPTGWAWQVPLPNCPRRVPADVGDVGDLNHVPAGGPDPADRRPTALVADAERLVPLVHPTPRRRCTNHRHLLDTRRAPIYIAHFTQASALERAEALTSVNVKTKDEKAAIAQHGRCAPTLDGVGATLSRLGGTASACTTPARRRNTGGRSQLAQAGLLKVICGTDTLGVGIDVPIRTVVFTVLSKYDGTRTRSPTAREIDQIAGARGTSRLRHRRHRRGAGARARGGEPRAVRGRWPTTRRSDGNWWRRKVPEGMVPGARRR